MTCKNCKKLNECLKKAHKDSNFAALMYNMCFWEVSNERCKEFDENAGGEIVPEFDANL